MTVSRTWIVLLTCKLKRDTKTQSDVSGTLQKSWDNEICTAVVLFHGNNISVGIVGSSCPTWSLNMYLPLDEQMLSPCQQVISPKTSLQKYLTDTHNFYNHLVYNSTSIQIRTWKTLKKTILKILKRKKIPLSKVSLPTWKIYLMNLHEEKAPSNLR